MTRISSVHALFPLVPSRFLGHQVFLSLYNFVHLSLCAYLIIRNFFRERSVTRVLLGLWLLLTLSDQDSLILVYVTRLASPPSSDLTEQHKTDGLSKLLLRCVVLRRNLIKLIT